MGLPRRAGDAAELRKSLKPLLEKRRRARINESLSQLRALLLPLRGRENSCRSKLEKADVLEMAVRFLRGLPAAPGPAEPPPADGYGEGYRACVARLARVLPACRVLEPALSARLLEHLRRGAAGAGGSDRPRAPATRPAPDPAPSPPAPCPPATRPAPSPPGPAPDPRLWRPW
ncbi:transcription factor HES-2 [Dipodomys spectabilis]|uniref:transcription factor HES-2 n=1 Tax=Dipodomys spectabilis TaxID=105255 RepID=UPI001C54A956|nr:transcription factor HES-2 [Dipodomys spectabilis]